MLVKEPSKASQPDMRYSAILTVTWCLDASAIESMSSCTEIIPADRGANKIREEEMPLTIPLVHNGLLMKDRGVGILPQ